MTSLRTIRMRWIGDNGAGIALRERTCATSRANPTTNLFSLAINCSSEVDCNVSSERKNHVVFLAFAIKACNKFDAVYSPNVSYGCDHCFTLSKSLTANLFVFNATKKMIVFLSFSLGCASTARADRMHKCFRLFASLLRH